MSWCDYTGNVELGINTRLANCAEARVSLIDILPANNRDLYI